MRKEDRFVFLISPEPLPYVENGLEASTGLIGLRMQRIAQELAKENNVLVASPNPAGQEMKLGNAHHFPYDYGKNHFLSGVVPKMKRLAEEARVNLATLGRHTYINFAGQLLSRSKNNVIDMWAPELIEVCYATTKNVMQRSKKWDLTTTYGKYLRLGQRFLYANDAQLPFCIGIATLVGALNPANKFDDLFWKVPFGVPVGIEKSQAKVTGKPIREKFFAANNKVLLWFSGVYPWYDLDAVVRAFPAVLQAEPRARLMVKGGVNAQYPLDSAEAVERARKLAAELGVENEVAFDDAWCSQHEKASWFADADAAIAFDRQCHEKTVANRTRFLDFADFGLPLIVDKGDNVGECLAGYGLAELVDPRDPSSVAEGVQRVLRPPRTTYLERAERFSKDYAWPNVLKPLNDCIAQFQ